MPWFRTLTLDRGEGDGVALDAPVLSATGVVGRVFAVGPARRARADPARPRQRRRGDDRAQPRARASWRDRSRAPARAPTTCCSSTCRHAPTSSVGDVVVTSGLDRHLPQGPGRRPRALRRRGLGTLPRHPGRALGALRPARGGAGGAAHAGSARDPAQRCSEPRASGRPSRSWAPCSCETALGYLCPGARPLPRPVPAGRRLLRARRAARRTACWRARRRAGCRTRSSAAACSASRRSSKLLVGFALGLAGGRFLISSAAARARGRVPGDDRRRGARPVAGLGVHAGGASPGAARARSAAPRSTRSSAGCCSLLVERRLQRGLLVSGVVVVRIYEDLRRVQSGSRVLQAVGVFLVAGLVVQFWNLQVVRGASLPRARREQPLAPGDARGTARRSARPQGPGAGRATARRSTWC